MRGFGPIPASVRIVVPALIVVGLAHAALWGISRATVTAPAAPAKFASLSFSPYDPSTSADAGQHTTAKQIRKDLAAVAPVTRSVLTYAATEGLELVPPLAAKDGLSVTQGIWIDKDDKRNAAEMKSGIELARKNPNVTSLVVGNEVIMRRDKTVPQMIALLREAKRQSRVPVTTSEIWNIWLDHPELASAVDYISVHILPYWEGMPNDMAVERTLEIYEKMRRAFPGKHIVISEFGWPSGGYNLHQSVPGRLEQARIIRDFMSRATARGIDYNIVEAIDQPWKLNEGSVGPYWGVFDASRHLKFPLSGPLVASHWTQRMTVALLLGLLLSIPIFRLTRPTFLQAAALASAANGVGAWGAVFIDFWMSHYFVLGAQIAIITGGILLIPLVMVILSRMEEIAAILFGRQPARLLAPGQTAALPSPAPAGDVPKVSIHVPAYREPPEMLARTLDAVARLDYPNFECVVVVNNTPDPALWQPVAEHCARLGERFKFVNEIALAGFKAGALRVALQHTAEDAEVIGVIDADYAVDPAWLRDLVPLFADPKVGLVQAPQDHRDDSRSVLHEWMNTEYAGFFDIGMVERNEANAIIVHGTMCLLRRAALEDAGGWSSDTICEDSDLGLAVLERGWVAHYTRRRYGWGLLPDGYEAFRKQRHRWAFGGVQIMMKHIPSFFRGRTRLSSEQRRTYLVGWMNWMAAETVGVAIALLNLVWVPVVVFGGIAIPEMVLTLPILASFVIYLFHFGMLYSVRVGHRPANTAGAAFAAMALQLTVARATMECLVRSRMPFIRTAKGGSALAGSFPAFWEAVLGALLVFGAVLTFETNYDQVREIYLFAAVLAVQAVPFLSAVALAVLERTPANDLAVYGRLRLRLASYLRGSAKPPSPADGAHA
jgi:exo-beta-1,3-glucanase (GH17 family)/cellulose synthase/poly-beta-1,6-N-acetylglucosamine synthase-like glycosyltransferase